MSPRKPRAHDIEELSITQFKELCVNIGWQADRVTDYGEDLLVRILKNGDFTGYAFLVQMKGTKNLASKKLKTVEAYTQAITIGNLQQWDRWRIPVVGSLDVLTQPRGQEDTALPKERVCSGISFKQHGNINSQDL